jgi:hypothetical protein
VIDSWINCPHCGTNVTATRDDCTRCGGDLKTLPDGSPNPAQTNQFVKAMQIGNVIDKAVFVVVLLIFAGLLVRFLF